MRNPRRQALLLTLMAPMTVIFALAMGMTRCLSPSADSKTDHTREGSKMISLLARAFTLGFQDYNPAYIIQAVNALHPLGKEQALAKIDTYLGDSDSAQDHYGLFWVLRVLFEVPVEVGFPPVRIGEPTIPPPAANKLPRFPIVMVQDIPFLVVRGYSLTGLPESVNAHVTYLRSYGTLRLQPLAPPISMEGIEVAFEQLWREAYGESYKVEPLAMVREQIVQLQSQHL